MSKKNELVATADKSITQPEVDESLFAFLPRAESSDFEIPRLTLCQPTSKIEGVCGDIIDSSTNVKISGLNEKLEFVPVWFFKDFAVTELDSKKFRRNEPKTPHNAHFSLFDNRTGTDPDGVTVKRSERLNLFVIRVDQLSESFPIVYRMLLKPSSFKEAKKLLSEWDIQIRSRLLPFQFKWSVCPKQITNDQGKFAIYEFQKVMDGKNQARISAEDLEKVKYWVKTLSANQERVMNQAADDLSEGGAAKEFETQIPF